MHNRNQNILSFFILIFIFSVPFWILDIIYPIELLPGLPLSALGVVVPALAAGLLVYRSAQFSGLLQLFGRALDFNRGQNRKWLMIAILINPLIAVLAFGIMRAAGVAIPNPILLPTTIFLLFLIFLISALAEEIGWTGYATEPLMNRWGIVTASVILGVAWSVWHWIPLLHAHRSIGWIAWWSLWTTSSRIIMGWLYIHSRGSVFIAALFHTMINLCWQLFPINGSFYDPKVFGLITFGIAVLVLLTEQIRIRSSLRVVQP